RCFRDKTCLELRPMTLLLGQNSAGKSTLLRLPVVLERSASRSANSPFDLSGPEGGGTTLLGSIWGGQRRISFELGWSSADEGVVVRDRVALYYEDHTSSFHIEALEITRDGTQVLKANSRPYPDNALFAIEGVEGLTRLAFDGLLPTLRDIQQQGPWLNELDALSERLTSFHGTVHWLSANRAEVPRFIQPQGQIRHLQHDGSKAAQVLVQDRAILDEVALWYQRPDIQRTLRSVEVGPGFQLLLDKQGQTSSKINLADTGDGMAQVMPVLVAAALAKNGASSQGTLLIEDPAAHLHENARRALADHLCSIAAQPTSPMMVLETHSRTFLLGVQLAIAKGVLPASRVVAYWIAQEPDGHSEVHRIDFADNGSPKSPMLSTVLAEDRALARELLRLQLQSKP
ncbi:MAG: hypothetical protein AAFX99_27405, partial [Myxococcota bacterium]